MLAYPQVPSAAEEWLASADESPDRVYLWWANAGIALLNIGARWEVVKSDALGHRAAVDGTLRGPIMSDPVFGHIYFLVPIGTAGAWDVAGTECLSTSCWLKVPAPNCTSPPGTHWIQAPDGSGDLVDPAMLRLALEPR